MGFVSAGTNGNQIFIAGFGATDDKIYIHNGVQGVSTASWAVTSAVYRDPSAWYHIVLAVDTTQATDTNRIKLYVNNQLQTLSAHAGASTYPTQNYDTAFNNNVIHELCYGYDNASKSYFDGYLTEVNFIDGQALTPSSFGETDSNTGVWKPKKYDGTYGTNGFFLKFADNSNTTAATLGKDSSGNGNNWTPNNFSVTAGAGNDSLVDSPTSYGTDTGVGGEVRGNYATLNPLNVPTSTTFSNGNLQVTNSAFAAASSTIAPQSGKWYMEFVCSAVGSQTAIVGVSNRLDAEAFNGNTQTWQLNYTQTGILQNAGTNNTGYSTWTTNDVLGLAFNCDTGAASFYKNNTLIGTITNSAFASVPVVFGCGGGGSSGTNAYTANFGQRAFAYTAPSGFKALCTQNLPTPTIGATSTTQANDYFNPVLYTGNGDSSGTGITNSISGVGFQPDFIWVKGRSGSRPHHLVDAVRGIGTDRYRSLQTNTTDAERTSEVFNGVTGGVISINSDGFTVRSRNGWVGDDVNAGSETFAAWNWKANGAGSSNTAGTITSTVSANTTSGFSIVTYTGTGANATVGHGLGVAPSMLIIKNRTAVSGYNWNVYHASIGNTQRLFLDATSAAAAGVWNNTSPTSTVFTIAGAAVYNNNDNFVAYCFAPVAGYSAFGSYTGNGSTDGPFVYTGFRPRYVLIKSSSNVEEWHVHDTARDTYNLAIADLYPNSSSAEVTTSNQLDILSNGFKCRSSNSGTNGSGYTFIYAAFAENPFKYSLAR
jgi:hypothetical protein